MSTSSRLSYGTQVIGRACALVILVALAGATTALCDATVTTDKLDYAPGDTVIITGTGWAPGEAVLLTITEDPNVDGPVILQSAADWEGVFENRDFIAHVHGDSTRFTLTAVGQTSGLTAQTTFTDYPYIRAVYIENQSPTPVYPGDTATYRVGVRARQQFLTSYTVGFDLYWMGTYAGSWSITGGPIQVPGCFLSCQETTYWVTLNVQVYSGTPPGTHTFRLRARRSGSDYAERTSGVVVASPTGSIEGYVTYRCHSDDHPVGNASVEIVEVAAGSLVATGTTNSQGHYRVDGLSPAQYRATPVPIPPYFKSAGSQRTVLVTIGSVAQANLTLSEATPPYLHAPSVVREQTPPGATTCSMVVPYEHLSAQAYDNCGYAYVDIHGVPVGSRFPVGTTEITYVAWDQAGNTTTQTADVIVTDGTPPVLYPPGEVRVGTGADAVGCWAEISDPRLGSPSVYENCALAGPWSRSGVPEGNRFPVGVTIVTYSATDMAGNTASVPQQVRVTDDTPPQLECPDVTTLVDPGLCTATVTFAPTATDNCGTAAVVCDPPSGTVFPVGTSDVTAVATDSTGNVATSSFTVTVENPAPTAVITGPASGAIHCVGAPIEFCGSFTDNPGDVHAAEWLLDSAPAAGIVDEEAGTVGLSHTFVAAGVYRVSLTISDQCGGTATATTVDGLDALVVVYDPSAGFVTGGGWILSPAGAYAADPTLTGKANFGFVSRYKKGASVPTGETEFQFKVAGLDFHSTSYDWMVIAGARAQYKGAGTINGSGNYGFMLTAVDGALLYEESPDRFRIKIVDKSTDAVVYDNQMGTPDGEDPATTLGGGSIVVHKAGTVAMAGREGRPEAVPPDQMPTTYALYQNRPNPFGSGTSIAFDLPEAGHVRLAVYDVAGRQVKTLIDGELGPGHHELPWSGERDGGAGAAAGVYFYRIEVRPAAADGGFTSLRRMVLLR